MISVRVEDAGFTIRVEQHGHHKLMRIGPFGRWNRSMANAFDEQVEELCKGLAGAPWAALWDVHAFPIQKPYIRAALERARRRACQYGMATAAVLNTSDQDRDVPSAAPHFASERDAIAFALDVL